MNNLSTDYNPEASSLADRLRQSINDTQPGRENEQANEPNPDVANILAMLTMIDCIDGDFGDVALNTMIQGMDNLTEEDMEKLKPEQYKDAFKKPMTFDEAWNHPSPFQRKRWREGIIKELKKMESIRVWKKVKRNSIPKNRRLIKCKWVFEVKRNGVFRCRLVACGYSQVAGIDFEEIFCPVANDVTFRLLIILLMIWELDVMMFDIGTAFLNADMSHEVYMEIPEGVEAELDECMMLLKTLYGTVQAAREWGLMFARIMKELGFKQSAADPCLFIRKNELGLAIVLIYVDDGLCVGDKRALRQFFDQLREKNLELKVAEDMEDYLSCQVLFSKDKKKAWLGQPHMVKKILHVFGKLVEDVRVPTTAGPPGVTIERPTEEMETLTPELQKLYRSGVGMLLYLVKHSRLDISNAVRELTKCMDKASPDAYKQMLRCIKYVQHTSTHGLRMEPTHFGKDIVWNLVVYSDSDWAGDKQTRRSVSGFVMLLCGVPIMWRSKQQKAVTLSSTEAEYYAASEAVKEILFVAQVLLDLGIPVHTPIQVKVDNIGAIFMSGNASSSTRTRHVDTRWHFVRELQEQGVVEVVFVRTADNWADGFTKNVSKDIAEEHNPELVVEKPDTDG